jgi:hypothetical protein
MIEGRLEQRRRSARRTAARPGRTCTVVLTAAAFVVLTSALLIAMSARAGGAAPRGSQPSGRGHSGAVSCCLHREGTISPGVSAGPYAPTAGYRLATLAGTVVLILGSVGLIAGLLSPRRAGSGPRHVRRS